MNQKKSVVILKNMMCFFLLMLIGFCLSIPGNDVQPSLFNSTETVESVESPLRSGIAFPKPLDTAECDIFMKTISLPAANSQRTVNRKNYSSSKSNVYKTSRKPVPKKSVTQKRKLVKKKEPVIHATRADVCVRPYKVYLSPSCQTWNPYCDESGSEEYHMRQIAGAMPAYLKQYGIQSVLAAPQADTRENQRKTIVGRVKQASDAKCDLYLAIHSNARDDGPKINGTSIFYPSKDAKSLRFAQTIADNFIYPDKCAISLETKDALWEMYMPKMPHCLIETAYHDNAQDVQWIEENTEKIAQNLADCIALNANVPTGVSINKAKAGIKVGKTCDLTAKVTLMDKSVNNNLTVWSSSNGKVAKVKNGTILGIAPGKTVITACTSNNLTAKCNITVYK